MNIPPLLVTSSHPGRLSKPSSSVLFPIPAASFDTFPPPPHTPLLSLPLCGGGRGEEGRRGTTLCAKKGRGKNKDDLCTKGQRREYKGMENAESRLSLASLFLYSPDRVTMMTATTFAFQRPRILWYGRGKRGGRRRRNRLFLFLFRPRPRFLCV